MANEVGYIRVQKDLKKKISKGEYDIGDLLPSENKLSQEYGLSRMTIRNALKNLELEGFIDRHQGKGSIIKSKKKSIKLLSIKGFTEIMKGKEIEVSTTFIQKPMKKKWTDNFYWQLTKEELELGCIHCSRIRGIQGKPVMVENTFITNNHLSGFCTSDFINNSLFDTLVINHDIEVMEVSQKFRAIAANEELSKKLNLEKGMPILEIIRKLTTSKAGLYIYSFAYCNTEDFTIEA